MAKSRKHQKPTPLTPEERAARKTAREAAKKAEEHQEDEEVEAATKAEANAEAAADAKLPPMPKKQRRKRTGKEIAVIVVSVIMVVSILLPSFSQIFSTGSSSSSYPTSFDDATDIYSPEVEEYKEALDKNANDQAAMLNLANAYYQWGIYATSYADGDDQTTEATELLKNAQDTYTSYLDAVGSLDSDDAKTAAINRAYCYYYEGDTDKALELLAQVADETNYAQAWANLGMMYENQGDTSQAESAYQKAIDASGDDDASVKSYCESQLSSLRKDAQESSGGAAGLASALDGTSAS